MRLGRFKKDSADRKRYVVDYENWMDTDELVTTVLVTGTTGSFVVDGYVVDSGGKSVIFFVSGGDNGKEYDATILINTSMAQIKEDWVTFVVTN